ncbi:hypothetical protein FRB96_007779 [Tulasnella sp. 330]|nr:hypothetical protein FRB96_007779 [Tulasnella sp. 330]KAG8868853.1 hypothetical protein FRB97_001856 [Tulasnella sp. 331]KAG8870077.1 hypothetical protein FRB98_001889 [Tulasnella sp. 332]
MVIAIAPTPIVIDLNENFPAPPVHSEASGEVVVPTPRLRTGYRKSIGDKHPAGKLVVSPIESFRLKAFSSSHPQDDFPTRSSAPTRPRRSYEEIPVTITKVPATMTEIWVQL